MYFCRLEHGVVCYCSRLEHLRSFVTVSQACWSIGTADVGATYTCAFPSTYEGNDYHTRLQFLERVVLRYFSWLEHLRSGVPDIAGLCNHWYCRMGAGLTRAFPFTTKALPISREVQCGSAWQKRQVSRPCVDMTPTRVLCRAS